MTRLMGESASLPIGRRLAIEQDHGVIVYPLRQPVDSRRTEGLREDDASSGFQPAREIANWPDGHAPLHPEESRSLGRRGSLWVERGDELIGL
jgi:hypothetical protein